MATDQVRMWRNADEDRVLLMAGQTSQDAIELQLAHRSRSTRCLLEAGQTTAAAAGLADQSHLHRHFQRSLGVTPAEYQQRFAT